MMYAYYELVLYVRRRVYLALRVCLRCVARNLALFDPQPLTVVLQTRIIYSVCPSSVHKKSRDNYQFSIRVLPSVYISYYSTMHSSTREYY